MYLSRYALVARATSPFAWSLIPASPRQSPLRLPLSPTPDFWAEATGFEPLLRPACLPDVHFQILQQSRVGLLLPRKRALGIGQDCLARTPTPRDPTPRRRWYGFSTSPRVVSWWGRRSISHRFLRALPVTDIRSLRSLYLSASHIGNAWPPRPQAAIRRLRLGSTARPGSCSLHVPLPEIDRDEASEIARKEATNAFAIQAEDQPGVSTPTDDTVRYRSFHPFLSAPCKGGRVLPALRRHARPRPRW